MNSVFTEIKESELVAVAYQSAEIEGFDVGKIEELFEVWKRNGAASLVASNPIKSDRLCDFMISNGMEVTPVAPAIFNRCYGRFVDAEWGVVVLCLDDFDGLGPIYNKLRYFRDERPHVPVILTSFDFKYHDLSQERLSICDLSIRLPIETGSEEALFLAAGQNNMSWMRRLAGLEAVRPKAKRRVKAPKVQRKAFGTH